MVTKVKKPRRIIYTELGREKRCTRCGEYWPADSEFFYRGNDADGLHSWCKACVNDETYRRRTIKVSPIPPSKEKNGME